MADLKKQIAKLEEELMELRKEGGQKNWLAMESKDRLNLVPGIKYQKMLKGHFGKIYAMHWANQGNGLVSASQDGKLIIWNAFTTHKLQAIILRSSWVMTCAFSPTSKFVACGGLDNICSVYSVDESKEPLDRAAKPPELREHDGYLSCCRFISDNEIVTTSGDGSCILWDIESKRPVTTFRDHTQDVMSVSVYENLFVTGSCDQTAKVWDYRGKKTCVMDFEGCHESDINSVAFFPDGQAFGTGSDNSRARLLDLRSCKQLQEYLDDNKDFCCVTSVDFSLTGKLLFAGYDDYHVQVWNVGNGQKAETLDMHENRVSCLGVSGDGKALCTGSWDTNLRIWA